MAFCCVISDCLLPSADVPHGTKIFGLVNRIPITESVTYYTCDEGFRLVGQPFVNCVNSTALQLYNRTALPSCLGRAQDLR